MQKRIYTVGQINKYIKNMFQGDYLLSGLCRWLFPMPSSRWGYV